MNLILLCISETAVTRFFAADRSGHFVDCIWTSINMDINKDSNMNYDVGTKKAISSKDDDDDDNDNLNNELSNMIIKSGCSCNCSYCLKDVEGCSRLFKML